MIARRKYEAAKPYIIYARCGIMFVYEKWYRRSSFAREWFIDNLVRRLDFFHYQRNYTWTWCNTYRYVWSDVELLLCHCIAFKFSHHHYCTTAPPESTLHWVTKYSTPNPHHLQTEYANTEIKLIKISAHIRKQLISDGNPIVSAQSNGVFLNGEII